MAIDIPEEYLVEHYPTALERVADSWIHGLAIVAAAAGAVVLTSLAMTEHRLALAVVAGLYGAALIAMLAFSAVYNLSGISPMRPFLRRLDEAGIFLMIAGSYTPFTTQALEGAWALGMTSLVWSLAGAGIIGKLAFPQVSERVWTVLYIAFGWIALIAAEPLSRSLPVAALGLLIAGGLVYTTGCFVFLNASLPFRRAVWHGFVCLGAALHFGAVASGVVIPAVAA
jgi:hemolysin III